MAETRTYRRRKYSWRGTLVLGTLLMGLWVLLSGLLDTFHLALGLLSVVAVLVLNARLSQVQFFEGDEPEWEGIRFEFLLGFLFWFVWEIVLGSLSVARIVLHPRMPMEPSILRFRVKLPRVGAKVLLGNLITLTPGTITLDIRGDEFVVHTLTQESSGSIIDGTMPRRVAELYDYEDGELITDVRVTRLVDDLHG